MAIILFRNLEIRNRCTPVRGQPLTSGFCPKYKKYQFRAVIKKFRRFLYWEHSKQLQYCGGENVRSGSEEIRKSNCNAYINCYADLQFSSLLALLTNTYTSLYSCVLFTLASVVTPARTWRWILHKSHFQRTILRSLNSETSSCRHSGRLGLEPGLLSWSPGSGYVASKTTSPGSTTFSRLFLRR